MANFAGINAAQGTIRLPNGTQVALRFAVAFSHDLPPGMNVDVMTTLSGQHKRVCR